MSHITSSWARQYGLPDPATTAAEITAASLETPSTAARALDSVVLALRFGRERARTALAAVESGWSTPNPHDAVRRLMTSSEGVEAVCTDVSLACADLSSAIAKAQADVGTAYAAADSAIASMSFRWGLVLPDIDELLRIDRERSALVWNLNAAISAIARTLDTAAAGASAAMAQCPGAALPAAPPGLAAAAHLANLGLLRDDLRAPAGHSHRFAVAVADALQQARAAGYTAQLLSYDPDYPVRQGGVAIAIGDVAQATSVSILVPGVGNSPMDIADSFDLARALNTAADKAGGSGSHTATVLWFGYDIPLSWAGDDTDHQSPYDMAHRAVQDAARAIDATDALAGGASLASFVRFLRPLTNPAANLTLIGHSYGSTTVAQSARNLDKGDGVSDIVLLGSPGAGYGVTDASDFRAVDADHVFSLSFPLDPVPEVGDSSMLAALNPVGQIARKLVFGADPGPFGPNPASAEFGANVISAPSNEPVDAVPDFDQHALSNYLSGSSLAAIGAVTAARYQQVPVLKRK